MPAVGAPGNETNPGGSFQTLGDSPITEFGRFNRYRGDHVSRIDFAFRHGAGPRVLDYGCGPGMAAFYLPQEVVRYVGVELDGAPLEWARRHVPGAGERAVFRTPESFRSEDRAERFDLILSLEVIEHVPDPRGLLDELLGRLAPSGRLVVSTPNGALSRHDPRLYQSPFHLTEFDGEEFVALLRGLDRPFQLYEQHRFDRVDVLPQLVRRLLLPPADNSPMASPRTPPSGRRSHPLFRLWEIVPQPVGLWRIRLYPMPHRGDRGFSHLIAIVGEGSAPASPTESRANAGDAGARI